VIVLILAYLNWDSAITGGLAGMAGTAVIKMLEECLIIGSLKPITHFDGHKNKAISNISY